MIASYREFTRRRVRIVFVILIAAAACIIGGVGCASAKPMLGLDPIGTKSVGDVFELTGQTTLPVGDDLLITIAKEDHGATGVSGVSQVLRGGTKNRFSFTVDTKLLPPGRYTATVEAISSDLKETLSFDLVGNGASAPATTVGTVTVKTTTYRTTAVTSDSAGQRAVATTKTTPAPTKTPGFEAALALEASAAALLARIIARRRTKSQ